MCKFCESLTDRTKEIEWSMRSSMADDTLYDIINENENVVYETNGFEIYGYEREGNISVGIGYRQELVVEKELNPKPKYIISPFSETIQFNFCPICGKQISKDVKDFEDYYEHQIRIDDRREGG